MRNSRTGVGLIGCGNISSLYLRTLQRFPDIEVRACADLDADLAQEQAEFFHVPKACSTDELVADPEISIVVNITPPSAHAPLAEKALLAGKSVYNEKPLATTHAQGKRLLDLAKQNDLRLGAAPDTFLGGGMQTLRKLVDEGLIGEPVAATAYMMSRGPESWHPGPDFLYQIGGGPLLDMGPYAVACLVNLLGPVRLVSGMARTTFPERTIGTGPRAGQKVRVETPTLVMATLEFECGALGDLITSFDTWPGKLPRLEVYGTEGTLNGPSPALFGGEIEHSPLGEKGWHPIPLGFAYVDKLRGLGVADMAAALRSGRPHRASAEMAYHVLDVLLGILESAETGSAVRIKSTCERPAPMIASLPEWTLDE
jgi:predicted dehydrogenase